MQTEQLIYTLPFAWLSRRVEASHTFQAYLHSTTMYAVHALSLTGGMLRVWGKENQLIRHAHSLPCKTPFTSSLMHRPSTFACALCRYSITTVTRRVSVRWGAVNFNPGWYRWFHSIFSPWQQAVITSPCCLLIASQEIFLPSSFYGERSYGIHL